MLVIPASTSPELAKRIAKVGKYETVEIERKTFPDEELSLRIHGDLKGKDVLVVCSTTSSSSIIELLLMLDAVNESGARSTICLIPYFGYSRQHKKYNEGEPVSSRVLARSISDFSSSMITVDIHDEATLKYSPKPFNNIKISKPISDYFSEKKVDYVLAPDDGSFDRAKVIAKLMNTEGNFIEKKRIDDNTVEMKLPEIGFKGKNVLLVDDMISTGGTMVKAAKLLRENGVAKIYVAAVHGLFSNDSDKKIKAVVDELVVTDTIETNLSKISVAEEVVKFLKNDA